jgi:hypothetical protein
MQLLLREAPRILSADLPEYDELVRETTRSARAA